MFVCVCVCGGGGGYNTDRRRSIDFARYRNNIMFCVNFYFGNFASTDGIAKFMGEALGRCGHVDVEPMNVS